ncbi:hypothetical protein [Lacrimispora xylanisolvens]|uniref:hypothetical protein n=1 Tax=Lacrimispora xylanisolvens TaxID=384636 RepID=UPI0024026668
MEEHKAIEQRYKSMTNAFDMQSAILNGNVTVTVSEAYTQPDPFMKEKNQVSAAETSPKVSQEKETEKIIKKEPARLEHSDLEELILELEEIAETGKVPDEHDERGDTV